MSRHALDRAHLLSSLRVALDELVDCSDAEQHYEGIWQLKEALEHWIARLDAEALSDIAKRGTGAGLKGDLGPIVAVE